MSSPGVVQLLSWARVIAVAAASRRLDLPAPLVLVAVGALASFVPFVPHVELTAELERLLLIRPPAARLSNCLTGERRGRSSISD